MFKEYSKVMGYVMLTIVLLSVVGGLLRFAGVFGERVAFENSYQYSESMSQRSIVLQSQIAEINAQIMANPKMRSQLTAQRKVLEIQLQGTK